MPKMIFANPFLAFGTFSICMALALFIILPV